MSHGHAYRADGRRHGPSPATSESARSRALWIALGANAGFLVVELVAALAFGSLALLADSIHMVSDVAALSIALVAQHLAGRPASGRHTYGLVRAEVLAGLLNAVLLLVASIWIVSEAIGRFDQSSDIDGAAVMIVAAVGFGVNAGSAWAIARVSGHSINLRGAFWHLAGDALGSLGAFAAGAAVLYFDATWVDPTMSLLIVVLIGASAIGLIRDATRVLLEGTPPGLRLDAIEAALTASPGVEGVHHTHLWSLGSETSALSTHVVLTGEPTLHDAQARGDALKLLLAEQFGILHATIELECHDCDTTPVGHPR